MASKSFAAEMNERFITVEELSEFNENAPVFLSEDMRKAHADAVRAVAAEKLAPQHIKDARKRALLRWLPGNTPGFISEDMRKAHADATAGKSASEESAQSRATRRWFR